MSDETLLPHPISDALQKALDDAVASRPAETRGTVRVTATTTGVEGSLAVRVRDGWEVGAWGATEWSGKPAAGIRVTGSW